MNLSVLTQDYVSLQAYMHRLHFWNDNFAAYICVWEEMVSHFYSQSDSKDTRFHYEIANDCLRYPRRNTHKDDSSAAMKCLTFVELKLAAWSHF